MDKIINLMVGRTFNQNIHKSISKTDKPVLKVEGLTNPYFNDINFTLYKGEILGFSGLVGSGRSEVARAIFEADAYSKGNIYYESVS